MADVRVIRFMRYRRLMAVLSGTIVLAGLVAIVLKGLNLGLDFTGGTSVEFRFAQAAHQAEVSRALDEAGYEDAVVQYLGDATSIQVRLPNQPGDAASVAQRMAEAVSSPANPARVMQVDSVGAQIGDELYLNSLIAVGLSLAMMMAYVSIRYQYKFAIGAVLQSGRILL